MSDGGAGGSDAIGPLVVLDVDPLTGIPTQRLETTARLDWTEPSPFISPDGKWLVAEAFVSDFADASFTALDLTTGATTQLPWQIPRGIEGRESFAWLPDNETMLYADGAILYALNVREVTRTEVGSVPDPDFAWLNRVP